MILYHKRNLVYTVVFPQFLIFQQNNSAQTSVLIFFTSRHYYFVGKLKIVEKQLCQETFRFLENKENYKVGKIEIKVFFIFRKKAKSIDVRFHVPNHFPKFQ